MKERKRKHYSVYDVNTELPLVIYGTANECAEAMGITLNSFWRHLMRIRGGKLKQRKWVVYEDETEDLEDG